MSATWRMGVGRVLAVAAVVGGAFLMARMTSPTVCQADPTPTVTSWTLSVTAWGSGRTGVTSCDRCVPPTDPNYGCKTQSYEIETPGQAVSLPWYFGGTPQVTQKG